MKIVIAPDSFKESLTALEVGEAIAEGCGVVFPDAELCVVPMADGGEGTYRAIVDALQGSVERIEVTGPLGDVVAAELGFVRGGRVAVVEMAQAAGLALVPKKQRNPLAATTRGVGELIVKALDRGCREVIIGLGGSATCDGGIGALGALGVRFLDGSGEEVLLQGSELSRIEKIEMGGMDARVSEVRFSLVCDVDNPLLGAKGAARTYSAQKGASSDQTRLLERGLEHYAGKIEEFLGKDICKVAGGGAAGGLAAGLHAFLGAEICPGASFVAEMVGLREACRGADLVVTGEGGINFQTVHGKTPVGVAALAREKCEKGISVPVIAIAGSLGKGYEKVYGAGIDAVQSIAPGPMTRSKSFREARNYLVAAAERMARTLKAGIKVGAKL